MFKYLDKFVLVTALSALISLTGCLGSDERNKLRLAGGAGCVTPASEYMDPASAKADSVTSPLVGQWHIYWDDSQRCSTVLIYGPSNSLYRAALRENEVQVVFCGEKLAPGTNFYHHTQAEYRDAFCSKARRLTVAANASFGWTSHSHEYQFTPIHAGVMEVKYRNRDNYSYQSIARRLPQPKAISKLN